MKGLDGGIFSREKEGAYHSSGEGGEKLRLKVIPDLSYV